MMHEGQVVFLDGEQPMCLSGVQPLQLVEVLEILVVGPDLNSMFGSEKEVSPLSNA